MVSAAPPYRGNGVVTDTPCLESRAICKYIAVKYQQPGTTLVPPASDLEATALFDQAMLTEISHYEKHISVLVWEKHIAP